MAMISSNIKVFMIRRTLYILFVLFSFFLLSCSKLDCPPGTSEKKREKDRRIVFYCADQSEQIHGPSKTYYKNGILSAESFHKHGVTNGIYKVFYPSGELFMLGHYKNGRVHGEWKFFYRSGRLKKIEIYEDGEIIKAVPHSKRVYVRHGKLRKMNPAKDSELMKILSSQAHDGYHRYGYFCWDREGVVKPCLMIKLNWDGESIDE